MRCKNFEFCGGCYHPFPYEEQLREKREKLKDIFGEEIKIDPSPAELGYRGRMDFVTAFGKTGLRKRKQFDKVVDIDRCSLISDDMNNIFIQTKKLLSKYRIPDYNYISHTGYLRYVSLREGKFTGQLMIIFITSNKNEDILPVIEEISPRPDSVVWAVNDTKREAASGEVYKIFKQSCIEEKFNNITYRISPYSFFQSNSHVAREMFGRIRDSIPGGEGVDLYCGVGAITLYVADKTEHITGVEAAEEAIDLARQNAELNHITNAYFRVASTQDFLREIKKRPDFVIADPPRKGLGKKSRQRLLETSTPRIIIMSCNPRSLKEDLEVLKKQYDITLLEAFDMFPYTDHLEMLAVLDKK